MSNLKDLYTNLRKAYSNENLNRITIQLIELYKTRNYGQLFGLANKISSYVIVDTENASKCFSGLIMLYHPDKSEYYRQALSRLSKENNIVELETFSHILLLHDLEVLSVSRVDEDIGYDPEYKWEDAQSGYQYFSESGNDEGVFMQQEPEFENSFYNIVKIRMYGTLDIEMPSHYLEDFEDVEFAESQIDSLDGIEYCKHVTELNLTGNNISDISGLWALDRIEELYLADNQIGIIDTLINLRNLRVLDISFNEIDDILALLELPRLEFVNLIGNNIHTDQIIKLKNKGIIIMH